MAWVSKFFTKNPNLKKREKKDIFCFLCWGGGGGGGGGGGKRLFFLQRIEIYTIFFIFFFFFFLGGGDGMEGVLWRGGSVARVSEFFLQIVQI